MIPYLFKIEGIPRDKMFCNFAEMPDSFFIVPTIKIIYFYIISNFSKKFWVRGFFCLHARSPTNDDRPFPGRNVIIEFDPNLPALILPAAPAAGFRHDGGGDFLRPIAMRPMIGVFDSGYGGLTVLRALVGALPDRTFLYLGDHAAAPYGNRSPDEIVMLTRTAVERLFGSGCRLVVLACNTAAAIALRKLQQEWLPIAYPDHRILGVLVPMVEAITGQSWMSDPSGARRESPFRPARTVAVFATRQTVASNAYPGEIGKRAPEYR